MASSEGRTFQQIYFIMDKLNTYNHNYNIWIKLSSIECKSCKQGYCTSSWIINSQILDERAY